MEPIHCLIMAGGSGTRFWPRSRAARPKQFLKIFGDESLIESTVNRFARFTPTENIWIISNKNQQQLLEDQCAGLHSENLIYEPAGRNTLPAIGLSSMLIARNNPDAMMVVSPADHLIKDDGLFQQTIESAVLLARRNDAIVTIGITPNAPSTGYGYIEINQEVNVGQSIRSFSVTRFVEKPGLETAMQYVSSGRFFWNSGIFVFRVSVFIDSLQKYAPETFEKLKTIVRSFGQEDYETTINQLYPEIEATSVDYGIMEKADNVFLVQGDFVWNDLGSWEEVYKYDTRKDESRNVSSGKVILHDVRNSYVFAESGVVAVVGLNDVIVVQEGDTFLVCKRESAEEIKSVVTKLKNRDMTDYL